MRGWRKGPLLHDEDAVETLKETCAICPCIPEAVR